MNTVKKYLDIEYFNGKTLLELGAGYGDNGHAFHQLGCRVTASDAREEHLTVLRERYPELVAINLDLDKDNIGQHYDIILHWGLLYHLREIDQHLADCVRNCDVLLLETEVADSDDPEFIGTGYEQGYDQAFNGQGCKPSPAYVERVIREAGMETMCITDSCLNSDFHTYDWLLTNTGSWRNGLRRMWFCWKPGISGLFNKNLPCQDLSDEFEFYPQLDSMDGDLKFVGKLPLDELKQRCRENPDCIGFNTLGFLKCDIKPPEHLHRSNYFGPGDGIFINKTRYAEQIKKSKQQIIPVKIVNLARRPDRRASVQQQLDNARITSQIDGWQCEFVDAVDGRELTPIWELYKLFRGNDFGSKRGVIGCALSHYYLWQRLLEDDATDFYLILEDDVTFVDGFRDQMEGLKYFMIKSEVLFFGYHMYQRDRDRTSETYLSNNNLTKVTTLDRRYFIGGTHCYSINKTGAKKLVDYIAKNRVKHGIDYVMKIHPSLNCRESQPHLALAEWADGIHEVDSDIQHIHDGIDWSQLWGGNNSEPVTVAFVAGMCERGTSVACYDYAYYNRELLGNKSVILYDKSTSVNQEVFQKFQNEFDVYGFDGWDQIDTILSQIGAELLYTIKHGRNDGQVAKSVKTVVHCVFDCGEPHGNIYAAISPYVRNNDSQYPVVPHMVDLPNINDDLRSELGIPRDVTVFGRHGGYDEFDVDYVQETVISTAKRHSNIYFLFLNTRQFGPDLPNIIWLEKITDRERLTRFINSCDAMIWGRSEGETFGLAIAEFSIRNKPVIASKSGRDRAHVELLADKGIWYNDCDSLSNILETFDRQAVKGQDWNAYRDYTPDKVMQKFKSVLFTLTPDYRVMDNRVTLAGPDGSESRECVLVSGFFDIGRSEWNSMFARSADSYIDSFLGYLDMTHRIYVFLDDQYLDKVTEAVNDKNATDRVHIIPINEAWLLQHTKIWNMLDRDKEVMNSDYYRSMLKTRIANGYPENCYSEYNLITHCKVEFIKYVKEHFLRDQQLIIWVDSGYIEKVLRPIDSLIFNDLEPGKFDRHKITMCYRNRVKLSDYDPLNHLVEAREIVTSGLFACNSDKVAPLYQLYLDCLDRFYEMGITDDDQHIYLQCFYHKPELFTIYLSDTAWPSMTYFMKPLPINQILNRILDKLGSEIRAVCCGDPGESGDVLNQYAETQYIESDGYSQIRDISDINLFYLCQMGSKTQVIDVMMSTFNSVADSGYLVIDLQGGHQPNFEVFCRWFELEYKICGNFAIITKTTSIPHLENFRFIRKMDHNNDDLYRHYSNMRDMLSKAWEDEQCNAFNTLGFYKSKADVFFPSRYFREGDGIFIKRDIDKISQVKAMCNWCNSTALCRELSNMCEQGCQYKNLRLCGDNDGDIDYYLIINKPPPGAYYNPAKTIVIQGEPWCYADDQQWGVKTWGEWANPDPEKFLSVNTTRNGLNMVQWQFHNTSLMQLSSENISKSRVLSTICSSKYVDPGHKRRIDFLKFLEDKCFMIDIYGHRNHHGFRQYLGPLERKEEGYWPYKYYFIAENNSEANYITEKLWEPILAECLCFYWGAPNVDDWIDERAFIRLDLDDFEQDYDKMLQAIVNDEWSRRIEYIRAAKQKIIHELGLLPQVSRLIALDKTTSKIKIDNINQLLPVFNKVCFNTEKYGKVVIFTNANDWYIETFIKNLLHSINIHEPDRRVAVFSSDLPGYQRCQNMGLKYYEYIDISGLRVNKFLSGSIGGTDAYTKLCFVKIVIMKHLLDLGYTPLYLDPDMALMCPCIDDLLSYLDGSGDFICAGTKSYLNSNIMLAKPNSYTRNLFNVSLAEIEHIISHPNKHSDEDYLRSRLTNNQFTTIARNHYPPGSLARKYLDEAKIIHANCVRGLKNKVNLLKECNAWYIDMPVDNFNLEQWQHMTLQEWRTTDKPLNHLIVQASPPDGADGWVEYPVGMQYGFCHVEDKIAIQHGNHDELVLCNIYTTTDQRRRGNNTVNRVKICETLDRVGIKNQYPITDHFNQLGKFKFIISPEGNGLDCHRHYEALFAGSIPIVERNEQIESKYRGLPVLFTDDYSDITPEYLDNKYKEMSTQKYDFRPLFIDYYDADAQQNIKVSGNFWCSKFVNTHYY